jgi:hypothetical protein
MLAKRHLPTRRLGFFVFLDLADLKIISNGKTWLAKSGEHDIAGHTFELSQCCTVLLH